MREAREKRAEATTMEEMEEEVTAPTSIDGAAAEIISNIDRLTVRLAIWPVTRVVVEG